MNGATLGEFTIYDKFDYLIKIDAPFTEREKRVIQRKDVVFNKNTMVGRDIEFKQAEKKGRKKNKRINEVVENTGTKEDLQIIADRIYNEQIKGRSENHKQTMQEKYGGYKTKPITRRQQLKTDKRQKDDLSK